MTGQLFEKKSSGDRNLLPYDGTVNYLGRIFTEEQADSFFQKLLSGIEWRNDEALIFGKKVITKRKVAWYGDKAFEYTYSNIKKNALPWTNELSALKAIVEQICGTSFNSCLLNLYHDGNEGMAWHSDAEKDLQKDGAIASLSFGAERKFSFRHISSKEKVELLLEHGSLLLMKDRTQSYWQHRLPPSKKVTTARINLTFRTIVE